MKEVTPAKRSQQDRNTQVGYSPSDRLLQAIRNLEKELHPHRDRPCALNLKSDLDRDLGFDSLARTELLQRLENAFSVTLDQDNILQCETPADLLEAIEKAKPSAQKLQRTSANLAIPQPIDARPDNAETLIDVLNWHMSIHADRAHVFLNNEHQNTEIITYGDLYRGATAVADNLLAKGLEPEQTVAIMLPTSKAYLQSFFGILMAGGIPVPIYPPARPSQLEEHLNRHAGILRNAQSRYLITSEAGKTVAHLLRSLAPGLEGVIIDSELDHSLPSLPKPRIDAHHIAFIQYTSGSTGAPIGVTLTHQQLLANLRIMGEAIQADSSDVFVSWLPLYHDMGLIGAWLGSLYFAMPLVLMSPLSFLAHPDRWLWAIHHNQATLSAGPNFAYELCLQKIKDEMLEGLDLSSWRIAFNGAEPVSPKTVLGFCDRYAAYGFDRKSMTPVYGLAEAAVGLAFPPLMQDTHIDYIDRERFSRDGEAIPTTDIDASLAFVGCGLPLPGYQIRAIDRQHRELPDRHEGRLQFKGPSATQGYYRNPEQTRELFDGEWVDTGDLGYIVNGEIYLTSRVKDIIIRAGRNIYPYELEDTLGRLALVRKGCVAVFGAQDARTATEKLIILAETRLTDAKARQALEQTIRDKTSELLGMPPDDVVLVSPRTILKTSSGKIRLAACRELYESGKVYRHVRSWHNALGWQLARVALTSIKPLWQRFRQQARVFLFASHVQFWFWLFAPLGWLAALLITGKQRQWRILHYLAQGFLRSARIPLSVYGNTNLQGRHCIFVSNHASYLDGLVLVAAIPFYTTFIAKGELRSRFISKVFLNRMGAIFVERFDKKSSVADARRLAQRSRNGDPLLLFPEGTLTRIPGLLPFHMGAFVTAVEAEIPVVPIVIEGTRSVLRSGTWLPRRGASLDAARKRLECRHFLTQSCT